MAIGLQVSSVVALILEEPKPKDVYEGQGDSRRVVGRRTDPEGRPVSGAPAVVVCEPLGMIGVATVLVPDMQAKALSPGAIMGIEGATTATLAGADYGGIRATVTGERVTPVGRWQDWVAQARPQQSAKGGEARSS